MGEPGSPKSDDKQVGNKETEEDATAHDTELAEEESIVHDSESDAQKLPSDLEPSESPEKQSDNKLLTEVEIKQEIVSDDDGSEYTSDEGEGSDNDDAKKLVIDESDAAKSMPKDALKPSPAKVTEKKPDERKSKPVEIYTAAPKKNEDSKQSKSSVNSDVKKTVSTKTSYVNSSAKSSKESDKTPVKTPTLVKKSSVASNSLDAEKSQTKTKSTPSKLSNDAVSPDKIDKKTPTKASNEVDKSASKEKKQTVSKSYSKADAKKSAPETTPKTSKEKPVPSKSSSSVKPSPSVTKADPKVDTKVFAVDKVVVKTENNLWHLPFEGGWKREIVVRGSTDVTTKRKPADVYYFAPCGTKLRSMPEIIAYLNDRKSMGLISTNFTFMKEAIYKPPQELTRQAAQRSIINPRATSMTPKTTTPKVKNAPRVATIIISSTQTPVTETGRPPQEDGPTSTIVDGQVVLGAKRWRKRKALPPDFLHTEQALSQRGPREPIKIQMQTKVTPTSKTADVMSPHIAQDGTDGRAPPKKSLGKKSGSTSQIQKDTSSQRRTPEDKQSLRRVSMRVREKEHSAVKLKNTSKKSDSRSTSTKANSEIHAIVKDARVTRKRKISRDGLEVGTSIKSSTQCRKITRDGEDSVTRRSNEPIKNIVVNGKAASRISDKPMLRSRKIRGSPVSDRNKPVTKTTQFRKSGSKKNIEDCVPLNGNYGKDILPPRRDELPCQEELDLFMKRKFVTNRPLISPDLDDQLYEFLLRNFGSGSDVSDEMLLQKSQEIAVSLGFKNFTSSSTFLNCWRERVHVSSKEGNNKPEGVPANWSKSLFTAACIQLNEKHNFSDRDICCVYVTTAAEYNCDTPFSIVFSALATGYKLPAFIIFTESKTPKPKLPDNIMICNSPGGLLTLETTNQWTKSIWCKRNVNRRLLISYKGGPAALPITKWCLRKHNTDVLTATADTNPRWKILLQEAMSDLQRNLSFNSKPGQQDLVDLLSDSWYCVTERQIKQCFHSREKAKGNISFMQNIKALREKSNCISLNL